MKKPSQPIPSNLQCNLHSQPFTLYCDRCLQPVCQKCTYLGPHSTSIHSLTPLHQSYQRRVQQLNIRLNNLAQTREMALTKITILTNQIQKCKLQSKQIHIQNDRNRAQIEERLNKSYENVLSVLNKEEENLLDLLNQINDLGHQFELLSTTSDIQCLINYQRILSQLKQVIDQLQILIQKQINLQQLPKQLSDIRIKLKKIQTLQQLYLKKIQMLKELVKKLQNQKKLIAIPQIDYEDMMKQINKLLERFQESAGEYSINLQNPNMRKAHFVCNFCGIIMDDYTINTSCSKNQINQQVKSSQSYYSSSANSKPVQIKLQGYCSKAPQLVHYGTHRHFFGEPNNPNLFFRIAYLNMIIGKQTLNLLLRLLPQSDSQLQTINQSTKCQNNSFVNYLQLLFLKIITLAKVKGINLLKIFQKQDLKQKEEEKLGYCEAVAMKYILMQMVGMSQKESEIVLSVCDYGSEQTVEWNKEKRIAISNYRELVNKLLELKI